MLAARLLFAIRRLRYVARRKLRTIVLLVALLVVLLWGRRTGTKVELTA